MMSNWSAVWSCNEGAVAEMKPVRVKTLVATLAVYLNALTEKGVHVVTVNDYQLSATPAGWARFIIF